MNVASDIGRRIVAHVSRDDAIEAIRTYNKVLATLEKKQLSRQNALRASLALLRRLSSGSGVLRDLPPAWADHVIATSYTMRVSSRHQKRLGAYFTPPHLVEHLLHRLVFCGADLVNQRVRDPAAGGAAFLVPIARLKVAAWRVAGVGDGEIVRRLREHLVGREISPELTAISNALLRSMLTREFDIARKLSSRLSLVKLGDSLDANSAATDQIDHEVGNPPFLRLAARDKRLSRKIFGEITAGRANLYALFVRRALEEVPATGLVAYVIPASFLGGPEFTQFRKRVAQLAEVLVVDMVENRSNVFHNAIQDICFLVLRRRKTEIQNPKECFAHSGTVGRYGDFVHKGSAVIRPNGKPWLLPGTNSRQSAVLRDWGYKATVGYLVANRQSERLHKRYAKGRYPLIWARAIDSGGSFEFERGAKSKGFGWVDAPANAPYLVRSQCVAIQRTSSRAQKKRINAAPICESFVREYGGVVGENHTILLVPIAPDAASPVDLARELNGLAANAELDRTCGSASISVRLLETIGLGSPPVNQDRLSQE